MFLLAPQPEENVIIFNTIEEKVEKLFEWGLITEKAKEKKKLKSFKYYNRDVEGAIQCDVVGYIPCLNKIDGIGTAVICIGDSLHKIMPLYLKQMQKKGFNFKTDVDAMETNE